MRESRTPVPDNSDGAALRQPAPGGESRFIHVLGLAALDLWSDLPQETQHQVFERAVLLGHRTEADESLREQLAAFLHDRHQRTAR